VRNLQSGFEERQVEEAMELILLPHIGAGTWPAKIGFVQVLLLQLANRDTAKPLLSPGRISD